MARLLLFVTALLSCQKPAPMFVDAGVPLTSTDAGPSRSAGSVLREVLLDAFPTATVDVPTNDTLVFRQGDHELTLALADLEDRCRTEAGCAAGVQALVESVRGVLKPDGGLLVQAEQVLPVLRADSWLTETDTAMKAKAPDDFAKNQLVRRPFGGGLSVLYAVRQPLGVRLVQARDLAALKLDARALDLAALKNLRASLQRLPTLEKLNERDVWSNRDADGLASSALLVPEWWAEFAAAHPDLVVTVPARGRLFAAARKDREALDELTTAASSLEKELLVPTVFRLSPKGFTVAK